MAGRFKVGDLVRHKRCDGLVFVVEFELVSADSHDASSLYRSKGIGCGIIPHERMLKALNQCS